MAMSTSPSVSTSEKTPRLLSVDALRGLIMVLMALDHANYFVAQQHSSGEYWGGPFPVYHDGLAFLTRLVTHLCAPGFFFLMGVGMQQFARSRLEHGWAKRAVLGHFLARGALLVTLQGLVVNRAWELSPGGWGLQVYIGVLFALGAAMILSAPLVWVGPRGLLVLSIALALGTEMLSPNPSQWMAPFSPLAHLSLVPGGGGGAWVNYPILPWLELVVFGMLFGRWLLEDPHQAYRRALRIGAGLLLAFVILRWLDGFGNIRPLTGDTWIDFLNTVKYPPSLTFTFSTLGFNLLLLGWFGRLGERWAGYLRLLAVYGGTALFFYVAHLFLYAGLGRWLTPHGTTIPRMYPYWLLGLLVLYPLCRGYAAFKRRQPPGSLVRFF